MLIDLFTVQCAHCKEQKFYSQKTEYKFVSIFSTSKKNKWVNKFNDLLKLLSHLTLDRLLFLKLNMLRAEALFNPYRLFMQEQFWN